MLLTVLMVFMSMNFSVFAEELTAPAGETTNSVEAPAEQSADEPAPAVVAPTPVDEETGTTEENATDNSLRQERPALLQTAPPSNVLNNENDVAKPIAVTGADGKFIANYDDINTAVEEAPTGSVIKLQQDITTVQTIQYGNKALTFDGDGQKYKITSSAERIFILDGTEESGTALTLKGLKVTGNGENQRGVHVGSLSDSTNDNLYKAQITLDNTIMDFEFSAEMRGINFGDGQHQGSAVTLTNGSKILNGLNREYEEKWGSTDTRGIALLNPKDVTVQIEKESEIKGFKYAVNVYGTEQIVDGKRLADAAGLNVTVDHSTIYGWAAFNIWASYGTYNIQNGSVLKGINTVEGAAGSANAFTTIMLNYDWPAANQGQDPVFQTYDNVLNITDSTITNGKTGSFDQTLLSIENAETIKSVNLKNARFIDVTGTINSGFEVSDYGNKSGSVSKAIADVKAKTMIDETSTSVYQPAEGAAKPLPFYDIIALNGDKEYQDIQEAIDDAAANDTIVVKEGTHNLYQTLKINKPVTIKGEDNKTVVITRGDAWFPKEGQATDRETASLILIENTKDVTLENLTVQGARKITGSVTANGHGINIVQAENVTLNNITAKDNAAAGIVVNGSTVTAGGLYTSGNGWYGVNVDQGSGITNPASFTLLAEPESVLKEKYQIFSDHYYADGSDITVDAPEGYVESGVGENGAAWTNENSMIKNENTKRTYVTIADAVKEAKNKQTISIPSGTYKEEITIDNKTLTLKGQSNTVLDGTLTVQGKNAPTLDSLKAGGALAVNLKLDASVKLTGCEGFDGGKITAEKYFAYDYNKDRVKADGTAVVGVQTANIGKEVKAGLNKTYTVSEPAELYWLAGQINSGALNSQGITIKLADSLDENGMDFKGEAWQPIGTAEHPFAGAFDGNGKTIKNLTIDNPELDNAGLFGCVKTDKGIGNVTIDQASITARKSAGALVGSIVSKESIKNVTVRNVTVKANHFAGAMAGYIYSSVENCSADHVTVTAVALNDNDNGDKAGGLIGFIGEKGYKIKDCTVTGCAVTGVRDVGGMVGNSNAENVYINCKVADNGSYLNTVTATGEGAESGKAIYAGGLIGRVAYAGNKLGGCSAEAEVTSSEEDNAGPLVGGPSENWQKMVVNQDTGAFFETIQAAIDANETKDGHTILIPAETYDLKDNRITLSKNVTLVGSTEGGQQTVLTCNEEPKGGHGDQNTMILMGEGKNAALKDLEIRVTQPKQSAINFSGEGTLTVENCHFTGAEGINGHNLIYGGGNPKATVIFKDNVVDVPYRVCITSLGKGSEVTGNAFNIGQETIDGDGRTSVLSVVAESGSVKIEGNTFKGANRGIGVDNIKGDNPENISIKNNKFINTRYAFELSPTKNTGSFDLSKNYYQFGEEAAGTLPHVQDADSTEKPTEDFKAEYTGDLVRKVPYYLDEAMTQLSAPVVISRGGNDVDGYTTITDAIANAQAGDVLRLEGKTFTESITIDKALTLEGAAKAGATYATKLDGKITITAKDVTVKNMDAETAAGERNGVVVTKGGAGATLENMTIVNTTAATGACGIRMEGENDSLTVKNADIKAERYYGIGVRNKNQTLNVESSTITGWAAIMTSAGDLKNEDQGKTPTNTQIIVKDSKLMGYHASDRTPGEAYGTVTLQENYEGVTFKAENTLFYAGINASYGEDPGHYQYGLTVRPYGCTIELNNCRFEKSATNQTDLLIYSTVNDEGGEPYEETAAAGQNTFNFKDITWVTGESANVPGQTKLIGMRQKFDGTAVDQVTWNNTQEASNVLTEENVQYNLLKPEGGKIEVSNAKQLKWIADQVNAGKDTFADKTITLTEDVDLSAYGNWTPIGSFDNYAQTDAEKAFSGTFDGANHRITGLSINSHKANVGLFGAINNGAAVKDLTIDGANIITTKKNAGALAGATTTNRGAGGLTITNVKVINSTVKAQGHTAGIIGWIASGLTDAETAKITGCSVDGSTIASVNDATGGEGDKAGAIIGQASSTADVQNCTVDAALPQESQGSVIAGVRDIGGIVGFARQHTTITNCFVGAQTAIKIENINPIEGFQQRDLNVGIGGILGTYENANACTLKDNTVAEGAQILTEISYEPKSNIVVYKGQYYGAPRSGGAITCDLPNNAEITFYGKEDAAGSGAVLKDIVENQAQAGDTINLAQTDYTSADAITIGKALTIKGLGDSQPVKDGASKPGAVINGQLLVKADATLENLSMMSTSREGAVIVDDAANAVITNCYAKQTTAGASDFANYGRTIVLKGNQAVTKDADSITGCYLDVPEEREHGITVDGDNRNVTVATTVIKGTDDKGFNKGIVLNGKNNNLTVDGTHIDTWGYAIDTEKAENSSLTIKNGSYVKGYAALSLYQANGTNAAIEDSTLIGQNPGGGQENIYGVIAAEASTNVKIKIDNTMVYAQSAENAAPQIENIIIFNGGNDGVDIRVDDTPKPGQALSAFNINNTATNAMIGYGTNGGPDNTNCAVTVNAGSSILFGAVPAYRVETEKNQLRNAVRNINAGMDTAVSGDTLTVPAQVNEVTEDWTLKAGVNLLVNNDTTFTGTVDGSSGVGGCKLTVANGKTVQFTTSNPIPNFFSVAVKDYDAAAPTQIRANAETTDDNSFVGSNMTLKISMDGGNRVWTVDHPTDRFDKGNGEKATPFTIATPEQLSVLAQKIAANEKYTVLGVEKYYADAYYKLTNDITVDTWTPIGKTNAFNGHFDGDGYGIDTNSSTSPLFGTVGKNAVIEKLTVTGTFPQMVKDNQGTLENNAAIFMRPETSTMTAVNSGTIKNSFTNSTAGLVKETEKGTLTNSYYEGAETKEAEHTYTKEDMQKARFAVKLNDNQETGYWNYDADINASAYPFIQADGKAEIKPLTVTVTAAPAITPGSYFGSVEVVKPADGKVYAKDVITLKAVHNVLVTDQYFAGWYQDTTKVATDLESQYVVTADANLKAQAVDKEKTRLTIVGGIGKITVVNSMGTKIPSASDSYFSEEIISGERVTITAEAPSGYEFSHWLDLTSNTNASANASMATIIGGTPKVYMANYIEKVVDKHTVIFNAANGILIERQQIDDNGKITQCPDAPSVAGRKFTGWQDQATGKVYTVDELMAEVIITDRTFIPVYKDDGTVKVTVVDGTIDGQTGTEQVEVGFGKSFTIRASEKTGMKFAGWQKVTGDLAQTSGPIVNYNAVYTSYIVQNTKYIATYVLTDVAVEQTALCYMEDFIKVTPASSAGGTGSMLLMAQRVVPDGCSFVEGGFIYKNGTATTEELNYDNPGTGVTVQSSTLQTATAQYSRTLRNIPVDQTISARAYLVYRDQNGAQVKLYSDMVTATMTVAN